MLRVVGPFLAAALVVQALAQNVSTDDVTSENGTEDRGALAPQLRGAVGERCDWIQNDDCQATNSYACFCRARSPNGPCTPCNPTSTCKGSCCGPQCHPQPAHNPGYDCSWIANDDCQDRGTAACYCRAKNPQGPCTSCSPTSACKGSCCGPNCGQKGLGPCHRLSLGSGSPWSSCYTSPGFPAAYGPQEHCRISDVSGKRIQVYDFVGEAGGYDYMEIHGQKYYTATDLQGLTVEGDVVWSSDSSVQHSGWKLCFFD